MSATPANVLERSETLLLELSWAQWGLLAGESWAEERGASRAMIDPEALLLGSLCLCEKEARLRDRLAWWAETGAVWSSVARVRALLGGLPEDVRPALGWFAARARDGRWKALRSEDAPDWTARPKKGTPEPDLTDPAALVLRLRAAFGVGAKADLLAFLLGASALHGPGVALTATTCAEAIGFSSSAVRRAAADMRLAGMIRSDERTPPRYCVELGPWSDLLFHTPSSASSPRDSFPRFAMWAQLVYALVACRSWAQGRLCDLTNRTVLASHARTITETLALPARWNGWSLPDPSRARGDAALDLLDRALDTTAEGIRSLL